MIAVAAHADTQPPPGAGQQPLALLRQWRDAFLPDAMVVCKEITRALQGPAYKDKPMGCANIFHVEPPGSTREQAPHGYLEGYWKELPKPFAHLNVELEDPKFPKARFAAEVYVFESPEAATVAAAHLPKTARVASVMPTDDYVKISDYAEGGVTGWNAHFHMSGTPLIAVAIGGACRSYVVIHAVRYLMQEGEKFENTGSLLTAFENEIKARVAFAAEVLPGAPEHELDEYWKWYPTFSRSVRDRLATVDRAYAYAGAVGKRLPILRRSNRILLDSAYSDGNLGPDPIAQRMNERAADQSREIRDLEIGLEGARDDAQKALADIQTDIDTAYQKFSKDHPELLDWKRTFRDRFERVPLDIALASGDADAMRRAAAEAESQGLSARARLIQADLYRANGDVVAALYALREAVVADANDAEAKQRLTEGECAFLENAIAKSQGAIRDARRAFYTYLMERGFGSKDTNPHGDSPWYGMLTDSSRWDIESAWAVFTTGLFGSFSAFYGKPDAEADMLATDETRLTTAYQGLHAILHLRRHGHSLPEIRDMTSDQMLRAMPLKNTRGESYTPTQAANLRVAVRLAMDLRDVKALVNDDRTSLQLGLSEAYWDATDVGNTWIEYLGDLTSAHNLILILLPSAKVGAVPGRILWGAEEMAALATAQQAGTVVSATEAVARMIYVDRALAAFGTTDQGRRMLALLERWKEFDRTFGQVGERAPMFMHAIGALNTVSWTVTKFAGVVILQGLAVHEAETLGGYKGALAMQAALMFLGDSELLIKLLKGANIPPQQVERLLVQKFLPGADDQRKLLENITSQEQKLEAFWAKQRETPGGQIVLSAEDFAELSRLKGPNWDIKRVPNGQPSNDVMAPLLVSLNDAGMHTDTGARGVLTAMAPDLAEETTALATKTAAVKQLAADLRNAAPVPLLPPGAYLDTFKKAPMVYVNDANFNYPVSPRPKYGSRTAAAGAALLADDYGNAEKYFRQARELIDKRYALEADELPLEFLALKEGLVQELKTTPIRTGDAPIGDLANPIPADDFKAVIDEFLANPGTWAKTGPQGAMSSMWRKAGSPYVIKHVQGDAVMQAVEGELVGQAIEAALGFEAPGVRVHLERSKYTGKVDEAMLVFRNVEGQQLAELSAGEIFQYRRELSRHRAVALLLGNFDTKIDNYLITTNGRRFIPIDRGYADLYGMNNILAHLNVPPEAPTRMAGAFGRDHWLSQAYKKDILGLYNGLDVSGVPVNNLWGNGHWDIFARKLLVAEESLTYKAAKPMVDKIKALIADEAGLRDLLKPVYEQIYGTDAQKVDDCVRKTVETFKARNGVLDATMQGLDDRNITRPPTRGSWLRVPQPGRGSRTIVRLPIDERVSFRKAA